MLASELITELTKAINLAGDLPIGAAYEGKAFIIKSIIGAGQGKAEIIIMDLFSGEDCNCPKCRSVN